MNMRVTERPHIVKPHLPISMGLSGRFSIVKFGRNGQRVPVRIDRSKRVWQRIWEHEQANLITNAGMDYGIGSPLQIARFRQMLPNGYLAVGTGSTAPAYTDNALVNEIARSNVTLNLGVSGSYSDIEAGRGQYVTTKGFDFGQANGNLTELGLSVVSTPGGTALTRALFVDELDSPIVITKTSDEQLSVRYTMFSSVGPTTLTPDGTVEFTGLGTFSVSKIAYTNAAGNPEFSPGSNSGPWSWTPSFSTRLASDISESYEFGTIQSTNLPSLQAVVSLQEYTGASFQRTIEATFPAGSASRDDIRGFYFGNSTFGNLIPYFGFKLTSPTTFNKGADYRLIVRATVTFTRD